MAIVGASLGAVGAIRPVPAVSIGVFTVPHLIVMGVSGVACVKFSNIFKKLQNIFRRTEPCN